MNLNLENYAKMMKGRNEGDALSKTSTDWQKENRVKDLIKDFPAKLIEWLSMGGKSSENNI